jgi:hypothetical protein
MNVQIVQTLSDDAAAASSDNPAQNGIPSYDDTTGTAYLHNTSTRTAKFLDLLSSAKNVAQLIKTLEDLKNIIQTQ